MSAFVVSRAYGELIEGYNRTQDELSRLINSGHFPRSCAEEEQAAMLFEERAEWLVCMRRCPIFVRVAHG